MDGQRSPEGEHEGDFARLSLRLLALLAVLLAALLGVSAPASALGQHGHSFAFSFGTSGHGADQFEHPAGIAIGEASRTIYVADRGNNEVREFQANSEGKPPLELKGISVPYPLYVAVDNSTESSDPSKGDVYVVGLTKAAMKELEPGEEPEEGFVVYKYSSKGSLITKLKKIKLKKEEFEEEFEVLNGVAVDSQGSVFVDQAEEIYEFNNASKNKPVANTETEAGETRPGLAIDAEGNIYTGVEEPTGASNFQEELTTQIEDEDVLAGILPESGFAVAAKLNPAGGVVIPELDPEYTAALAVNPVDEAATGVDELNDSYAVNVSLVAGKDATTVAAFDPHGALLQRITLPHTGTEAQHGDGIAVDSKTGDIYVADASADRIDVFELEQPAAPTVTGLSACTLGGPVPGCPETAGGATLSATVNPHGADTHYHFEYGPASCSTEPSPCTSTPTKDAGQGYESVSESEVVENLPAGIYHYRIVASNALDESGASEERTFTILGSAGGLPDGRQWQLVSPAQKGGNEPEPMSEAGSTVRSSENGEAITYAGDGPMGTGIEGNRAPEYTQLLSTRGAGGWNTSQLSTPNDNGTGVATGKPPEYSDFTPNLALALLEPYPGYARQEGSGLASPPLSPPVSATEQKLRAEGKPYQESTIYLRADRPLAPGEAEAESYAQALEDGAVMGNPGYLALVTELNAPGVPFGAGMEATTPTGLSFSQVATPDLSHVVFKSRKAASGAYEWSRGGTIQLVSALPAGSATSCAEAACKAVTASEVSVGGAGERTQRNAISNDGTRIVLTGGHDLYVRDTTTQETIKLDTLQSEASGEGEPDALYEAASTDGSKVFFTDQQRLTKDSKARYSEPDLYVAELSGGNAHGEAIVSKLTDLTPEGIAGESANVPAFGGFETGDGVLGASEDGSYVYFAASAALAPGATRAACYSEEGTCNLYVRHYNGSEWEPTRWIALLSGEDSTDWGVKDRANTPGDLAFMTSRVSPNGAYLAFMSIRSLTGYDNEDLTSKAPGERLDDEVYLYSAPSGELTCASCNPTGKRPAGVLDEHPPGGPVIEGGEGRGLVIDRLGVMNEHWLAGSIPGWTPLSALTATYQSRYLSNEGRLFFDSPDTLVPAVAEEVEKGKTSKNKVYEYEPDGLGSCESAGGCVGLISGAGAAHEAAFLDASANGDQVFFLTAQPLVPQDGDESFDVYDASVCSESLPCLSPPAAALPVCRSVAECREGSYSAPGYQAPASSAGSSPAQQTLPTTVSKLPTPKKLTLTQQLENALKACGKESKAKRAACEKQARAKYEPLIRAQNLANALKACKKDSKAKRAACEKLARKRYGARSATKKTRLVRTGRR